MEEPTTQAALDEPSRNHIATFHHVGYVVRSIAEVGADFARSFGAAWDGAIIHDSLQEARVTFMRHGGPQAPAVELVEPVVKILRSTSFLERVGGCITSVTKSIRSINNSNRAVPPAAWL